MGIIQVWVRVVLIFKTLLHYPLLLFICFSDRGNKWHPELDVWRDAHSECAATSPCRCFELPTQNWSGWGPRSGCFRVYWSKSWPQWTCIFLQLQRCESCSRNTLWYDDVIQWKVFPCYWPFVLGIVPSQRANNADVDVSLMWVYISCWTNSRMTSVLRLNDVHVTSSWWHGNVTGRITGYLWGARFHRSNKGSLMRGFGVLCDASQNKLLKKQWNCR